MGSGEDDSEDVEVRDTGHLTSFSIDDEYTSNTLSERRGYLLRVSATLLIVESQKPYRRLSPLVFDLLSALASTVSSCQPGFGNR